MDIRITKITLHNFKGVRDASFQLGGKNARIEGENGAGKSTVFDAFVWLLFGKDHQGQDWTNFDLKPIDPQTLEPFHGLEHWVEAELTIDGVKRTLRRFVTEDWVKPKGATEKVLKGHAQQFFVDGINTATKKAYDETIAQWIGEGVFKLITNPLFFIDDQYTDWKSRRKAILSLVGDTGKEGLREQFADLVSEMNGEPMELFKKRIAAEKKANRDDLKTVTTDIAAYQRTLPEEIDVAAEQARIDEVMAECEAEVAKHRARIAQIDAEIENINETNKTKTAKVQSIWRQITKQRQKMADYIAEKQSSAQAQNNQLLMEQVRLKGELHNATSELDAANRRKTNLESSLSELKQLRQEQATQLTALGEEYGAEREKVFDPASVGVCPTCGQPLPESMIAERGDEFAAQRKARLQELYDKAVKKKADIASTDASIEGKQVELSGLTTQITHLQGRKASAEKALQEHEKNPTQNLDAIEAEVRRSREYLAMVDEEMGLNSRANALQAEMAETVSPVAERKKVEAEIEAVRREYDARAQVFRNRLAVAAERDRILRLIETEKVREKRLADEVARLERLEFRAAEYTKAEIDAQEGAINALFRVARWKMFDRTIDGGIVEMCEVTSETGVPYRSMNDAKKILCGMDVIRVFSEHSGCSAPIFIDNAESITRKSFDTPAQVIRLVVTEGSELTMYHE